MKKTIKLLTLATLALGIISPAYSMHTAQFEAEANQATRLMQTTYNAACSLWNYFSYNKEKPAPQQPVQEQKQPVAEQPAQAEQPASSSSSADSASSAPELTLAEQVAQQEQRLKAAIEQLQKDVVNSDLNEALLRVDNNHAHNAPFMRRATTAVSNAYSNVVNLYHTMMWCMTYAPVNTARIVVDRMLHDQSLHHPQAAKSSENGDTSDEEENVEISNEELHNALKVYKQNCNQCKEIDAPLCDTWNQYFIALNVETCNDPEGLLTIHNTFKKFFNMDQEQCDKHLRNIQISQLTIYEDPQNQVLTKF